MAFDLRSLKNCGVDVRIAPSVVITHPELVSIGDHVSIDDFTYITTSMEIENYVHIGPHCSVIGGAGGHLYMGNFSGFASGCRLVCLSGDFFGSGLIHPFIPPEYRGKLIGGQIRFERFAGLGTGVIVHPSVTVGEGTLVGSASLVLEDLPPWHICHGIPAKPVHVREKKTMLEYGERLLDTPAAHQ